ncbi:MAG TPA: N-acetylmuramoyl-L-alanine amidase [Bauldia sp.]|nr:N-acetylmuramoyl-L-alanine amidase [Bauldia sp.]
MSQPEMETIRSPNEGPRAPGKPLDMLILHYTGMESAERALKWLVDPESAVSSHYFVFEDGRIVRLVDEDRRAWHAGKSVWEGETDINSRSIGIEIANPGHEFGYRDFPEAQIAAVTALSRDIVARLQIPPLHVLAHSDVAPMRKEDPGERFPWRRLAEAGVGLWVEPSPIVSGPVLQGGDHGPGVGALKQRFKKLGYGIGEDSEFDDLTEAVVTAFQRHWRPARVDGVADVSTVATLEKLLAAAKT